MNAIKYGYYTIYGEQAQEAADWLEDQANRRHTAPPEFYYPEDILEMEQEERAKAEYFFSVEIHPKWNDPYL